MSYPIENIIPINVRITPAGLNTANFASAMLFAKNADLPVGFTENTKRTYFSVKSLAQDFATTTETYKAGAKWLGSTPAVQSLTVWATDDTDANVTATLTKAFDANWWYWTFFTSDVLAVEASALAIAQFCENNNIMFVNDQTGTAATAIRNPALTTDIASKLNVLGYRHVFTPTHATDAYAGFALAKHFAVVNYSADNSTITGEFKKSPGVAAEDLTDTAYATMLSKKATFYSVLDLQGSEDAGRWLNTWTHSTYGEYIDDVINLDALVNSLRVGLYNALANQPTKLAQTPVGQAVLLGAAKRVCEQFVRNNYLGPRNYINPDSGLEDYTAGYEILTKPEDILDLSDADRAQRKSAPIRIRVFKAGAIHIVDVTVDVY
jgi:hypothetical protein